MIAHQLGRCRCSGPTGPEHEHSDFGPFACVDCPCPQHRHVETADSLTLPGPQTAPQPAERPCVTIPAGLLDFARQRVTQTAQWLDPIVDDLRNSHTMRADADDPLAVCALADTLQQHWPDGLDAYDALALTLRRLAAATKPDLKQRMARIGRRMRQGR